MQNWLSPWKLCTSPGEESLQQVALRAQRLGLPTDKLKMLSETSVESICQIAQTHQPKVMVVDSIQVVHMADVQSAPGSVSQVRESAAYLTRFCQANPYRTFFSRPRHQGWLPGRP